MVELLSLSFTFTFQFGLLLSTFPLSKQTVMQRCLIPQWKKVLHSISCSFLNQKMAPLHNLVTWYGINYAGMQLTQWDFQNNGKSGWTGMSSFVLEVPLCNLQRAQWGREHNTHPQSCTLPETLSMVVQVLFKNLHFPIGRDCLKNLKIPLPNPPGLPWTK